MRRAFSFDAEELFNIGVSLFIIALAFSLRYLFFSKAAFLNVFSIVLIGVGSGFVLHELAHKFVAVRFGAFARYQAWGFGLGLALLMALVTRGAFVFAAPGAVYIYSPYITRRQNGLISIAGPLTNLLLGFAFLAFGILSPRDSYAELLGFSAASVNFFLGFFNMLPIPPLDGSKVLAWSWMAWLALITPLALMTFLF